HVTGVQTCALPISERYLIEKSTLEGKKDLLDFIEKESQQQKDLAMAQAQADLQQSQMVSRSFEAKAQSDFGRAIESKARSLSNIGLYEQRKSQGAYDLAKASLD